MPRVFGYGALFGVVLAVFDYTGNSLKGSRRSQELDEFDRKEYLRKNRRRPLEETLAEVGEGRCEQGPSPTAMSANICGQRFARPDTRSGGVSV